MTHSVPKPISEQQVIDALKTVDDPELSLDIYTLGLIYNINLHDDPRRIVVTMTYTTPFCPYGPQLRDQVYGALAPLGFEEIKIEVTFDPPWKPSKEVEELLKS